MHTHPRAETSEPVVEAVLFEAADVGRMLDLHPGTVRRLAKEGVLRVAALTRRGRLFAREDIEALRQQRAQGPQ